MKNSSERMTRSSPLFLIRHLLPLEADGSSRDVEERVVKSVTSEMVREKEL